MAQLVPQSTPARRTYTLRNMVIYIAHADKVATTVTFSPGMTITMLKTAISNKMKMNKNNFDMYFLDEHLEDNMKKNIHHYNINKGSLIFVENKTVVKTTHGKTTTTLHLAKHQTIRDIKNMLDIKGATTTIYNKKTFEDDMTTINDMSNNRMKTLNIKIVLKEEEKEKEKEKEVKEVKRRRRTRKSKEEEKKEDNKDMDKDNMGSDSDSDSSASSSSSSS